MLKIPAFGEVCIENRVNDDTRVYMFEHVEKDLFDNYCALLEGEGYEKKESSLSTARAYAAYCKEGNGVFLNFYFRNGEMTLVTEDNTSYFSYTDRFRGAMMAPQITQVHLEDFGLSYVIRLSDGRFIIFDGGWNFEPDRNRLFECLKEGSPDEKPVIAAWILTHPHGDHYLCFLGFMEQYGDQVVIEKFLFNFPEFDDIEHYPKLKDPNAMQKEIAPYQIIPKVLAQVEKLGVPVYTPRTGQRYRIGDADCEILSCMDETIHCSEKINALSLVIRMELGGQVILWTTDASFSFARIPQRYGDYLKADILQIPHHGFQCGDAEEEIMGYDLISPKVCFMPVSDENAYTVFCSYQEGTRHVLRNVGVEEVITGTHQKTITLPYTAPAYAKRELEEKFLQGRENCGARTWIFSDLSTNNPEDFIFTILNTTVRPAEVFIDIFFEERPQKIRNIRAEVTGWTLKKLSIIGDEIDSQWGWLKGDSLATKGIPENSLFAVRFTCVKPIVVTHKTHTASYHSVLQG